ncbi:MAG TPA: hypothetical protein VLJ37_11250 [bacterium]|nr:hypothetical protein [bacterium]
MTDSQDPIHFFWEKFSQAGPDGRRAIRFKDRKELVLLYEAGFVDAVQFNLDEWTEAFKDSLQTGGGYVVSEKQWAEKKKYMGDSPVGEPFDPLQIREGEWTREEFDRLIEEKIFPEMLVSPEEFRKNMEPIRAKIATGGRLTVGSAFKLALKQVLDRFPSPRRLREMGFAALSKTASPTSPATGFSRGPSPSSTALGQLGKLLKKQ